MCVYTSSVPQYILPSWPPGRGPPGSHQHTSQGHLKPRRKESALQTTKNDFFKSKISEFGVTKRKCVKCYMNNMEEIAGYKRKKYEIKPLLQAALNKGSQTQLTFQMKPISLLFPHISLTLLITAVVCLVTSKCLLLSS